MQKYSIILPVYNGGEYVKECLRSILAQTFTDFNVIVLDSLSTDGSLNWIKSLQDHRITIHAAEKPLTIEENWNRITGIPKNEFITVIGHDDLLHPDYLADMDQLISKHPKASLYQAHFNYINSKGNFVRPCLPMDEVQYAHEFLACHFCRTLDSMGSGYMMRSRDYDLLGGIPPYYPNLIFADYELWIRLSHLSYKATSLQTTFSYRLHESVSKKTNGMQYQQAFGEYVGFIKDLMQKDPKVEQIVKRYGKGMLLYYCESLSHRLLKTPAAEKTIKVADYIRSCEGYAQQLIPGQEFKPLSKFRIRIAKDIDESKVGKRLFSLYKKIIR
jgi:glycosyltransferase involved in cell wall biosynthesis